LTKLLLRARRSAAIVLCSFFLANCFAQGPAQAQDASAKPLRPATLDDLYGELNLVDSAISPNGQYVAAIARLDKGDVLVVFDLVNGGRKVVQKVEFNEAGKGLLLYMLTVDWKTDDKLMLRLRVRPEDMLNFYTVSSARIAKLGDRLFAIERATGKAVALLGDNRNAALEGAFDLGDIRSLLPKDPQHILMELNGFNGRSLFKVNIETGRGEQIERPLESVMGWWLDLDGRPVVRESITNRTIRLHRKDENSKWKEFYRMRLREAREAVEYDAVGPSDNPDKYYVRAVPPGRDRLGIYLYDLKKEEFGEPIIEHPTYDLLSARIKRDGTGVQSYCYMAHVRICEFTDPKINAHMRGLRKYFNESANVLVENASDDGKSILLYVEGPVDPPGYYYYQVDKKDIQSLGSERKALDDVARPVSTVFNYKSRDGKDLHGYLTLPANAPANATKLPLVVYPHGGPEVRDILNYDRWAQFFAARGYAVFQPNYRGSAGFGRAFAESGYGEWGRKMQDDITDGVKALVDQGTVDAARVAIVGASYGGYAALAGASLTPDVYKCAVSIAGISDLDDMIGWSKRTYGSDSKTYEYVLKVMGDPDKDAERIRATSPAQQADKIKIPVLLIHGTDDAVVPVSQSRTMKKALEKTGARTEFIELEKEGHSYWEVFNEVRVLNAIDAFLWKHLGPGQGVTKPPKPQVASK
jgi:dienelactone hydrolase